jgi:ribonuclease P protein component
VLGFGKNRRLATAADFERVFGGQPIRISDSHFLILAKPNSLTYPRLGLVIAKKHLRLAVERNRIKRCIRESFRHHQVELSKLDIIVLSRKDMGQLSNAVLFDRLKHQWQRLIKKTAPNEKS